MNIPMPGHPVGDSMLKETLEAVSTLEKLVEDHDVVFMLTDSRESRWLPTLLAGAKKKVITVGTFFLNFSINQKVGHLW